MYKLVIAAVIGGVFGVLSSYEYEDDTRQEEEYCDMVAKWEVDAAIGLPAHHRGGWPPYRNDITCK